MKYVLILLVLTGCASTIYTHPTKSETQFDVDKYDCQKVAEQRTANTGFAGNIFIQADFAKECMEMEKGWRAN